MHTIVTLAQGYACAAHRRQKYGDLPYRFHLAMVANTLMSGGHDADASLVAAGWLHDILEDTDVTRPDLLPLFGDDIVSLVEAVTDEPGVNRKERKAKTLAKTRAAGTRAVCLKLADRIANVGTSVSGYMPDTGKLAMYRKEQPAFREALYKVGECDSLWQQLEELLKS